MRFIKIILISLLPALFIYACTGSNKSANSDDFPGDPSDSLVASIERTPCFGTCPAYKVHVYRSGYATYEGRKFAPREGLFTSTMTPEQMRRIGMKAEELGYFEFKEEYRNPHLTDFPTIYSEVRFRGKKKRVTHYDSNPPEGLTQMEQFLDSVFNELEWKQASAGSRD